jgi:hypothetical protein
MINVVKLGALFLGAAAMASPQVVTQPKFMFSPEERDRVYNYWTKSAKYEVLPPEDIDENGPWRVRLSVEGSTWLYTYNKKVRPGKIIPNQEAKSQNPQQEAWDAWIDRRYQWDIFQAETEAAKKNAEATGRVFESPRSADAPGPMPADLKNLAGAPPPLVEAVEPKRHKITFADGMELIYNSHVNVRPKYPYYRSHTGVASGGVRVREMTDGELKDLFKDAGITDAEAKVFKAVSLLEGGFDSLNTYDTGFVSVGFIQFACLSGGGGSLGSLMTRMKERWPDEFDRDFRTMGIDVTPGGLLVALDPESGAEFTGHEAANKIISDRRLAAVFQHAGRMCRCFKVAQLQVAKDMFYPGDDLLTVTINGEKQSAKIKEVVRTEAGLATLMDRKVNTGKMGNFVSISQDICNRFQLEDIKELSAFEYDIVRMMTYREDYLADSSLSRPRANGADVYRNGTRGGRTKRGGG